MVVDVDPATGGICVGFHWRTILGSVPRLTSQEVPVSG